ASAAAVTASFNTPIAGVIFALEVVVGYYALRVFAPVVVAAMGAVIVRHSVYGNVPEFSVPDYIIGSLWELVPFALLGVLAACVVQACIYMVICTQRGWAYTPVPLWCRPAIAGALIGVTALSYPLILGVGYEGTALALNEELDMAMLIGLLLAKTLCAAIALGSGFAGGVFSPALFIGAMLGGAFWWVLQSIGVELQSSPGVYSVVGMAAVASAMLGAPISTLLIVFELTIDYDLVIAVMLAAAVASTCMQLMPYSSFFRWQLHKRGINLTTGRDQSLLRTRTIDSIISANFIETSPDASLQEVEDAMFAVRHYIAIVINEQGEFSGSLSTDDIFAAAADTGKQTRCGDVSNLTEHAVPTSSSLLAALQKLNELDTHYAPVTRMGEEHIEVIGVIYRNDVLNGLYDLLRQARSEEYGVL
ncbi:MAG: chloride channel protein, partial [Pseudomonadota bacterium]